MSPLYHLLIDFLEIELKNKLTKLENLDVKRLPCDNLWRLGVSNQIDGFYLIEKNLGFCSSILITIISSIHSLLFIF